MDAVVRELRDADAPAVTALLRPILRGFVVSETLLLHWRHGTAPAAHANTWVAEREREIVGWGKPSSTGAWRPARDT